MIDPTTITNFNRTLAEQEEFLVFAVCVAGKKATQMAPKVHVFCGQDRSSPSRPFEFLRIKDSAGKLRVWLEECKIGNYTVKEKCIRAMIWNPLFPDWANVHDLETLPGIGPKTARFFILHSRPNQRFACLDVHILRELRDLGYKNIPKQSPSNANTYARIEKIFLAEADKRGKSPANYDLEIWKSKARL
jgi:hypothetical protein